MTEILIGKASELKEGDRLIVKTSKGEVGLFVDRGQFYAYANMCPHQGGPACEGILINEVVDVIASDRTYQGQTFSDERHFVCPWHGYEFKLETGECNANKKLKVKKFAVVQKGEDVYVKI